MKRKGNQLFCIILIVAKLYSFKQLPQLGYTVHYDLQCEFLLVCICFNLCRVRKNDKEPNVCFQDYRTSQFNFLLRKNSHKALKETK